MQISKVATAVALSTGLLFGCNSDGLPIPTEPTPDPGTPTLTAGYWQISDSNSSSISASSNADLPNVYVFQEDGNHKYYDDDDNLGTYTIKDASASTNNYDEEAGTVSFTYYETGSSTLEILDGVFTLDDSGALIVTDNSSGINYSGSDQTEVEGVQDAVTDANDLVGINGYVQILDTNHNGSKTDSGELRLKLSDSSTGATVDTIASGKMTVDLIYQVDEDTTQEENTSGNNAYISLFASGTSNINLHGEVIFNAGEIFYRSTEVEDGKPQISDEPVGTYTLGEDLAVEISWTDGYYSFTVNDNVYDNDGNGFESFDKAAVTVISLKLGDTSNTTHYEMIADNFKVYSHDTTTDELVFEDDFNGYPNGHSLSGNPYNSATAEATVIVDGDSTEPDPEPGEVTDNFDSYTVGTQIDVANPAYKTKNVAGDKSTSAAISDDFAKSGSNSLRLEDNDSGTKPAVGREFADGAATTGSVSTSVYIPSAGYDAATYVFLGSNSDGSSGGRYTEVVFTSSMIKFRNETGSQVDLASYSKDTWVDLTISWEGTDITVNVDGTDYTGLKAQNSLDPDKETPTPTALTLYVGDNSSVATYSYFDNLDSDLF
ncbi:hypothetical protein OQJ65_14715 [Vibrio sp. Sgm 22]|uniref:hypothetical protein n=1 Tax=unclassified Vibrio TaxID=2614977 RepID=UPI00224893B1|nr:MULTISPECIES: hypothetical protein [unclassified Vibrio]MCX2759417.1 hypothetical protein [Vibrio sp. 14G-20]MCX2776565.1 hypothetical protein [Vibrio sp. Sgm 22]